MSRRWSAVCGFVASAAIVVAGCSTSTTNTAPTVPRSATTQQSEAENKIGWFNAAVIAQSHHHDDAATTDYMKALTIDPDMEAALYNYGLLSYETNDTPNAIVYLRRAATVNPKNALAWWYLGLALQRIHGGSHTAGISAIRRALELDPALLDPPAPQAGGSGANASAP